MKYSCRFTEFPYRPFLPEKWEEFVHKQSWPGLQIRDVVEGKGVFSTQEFRKGDIICNYGGNFLEEDYVKKYLIPFEEKCTYLLEMHEKFRESWGKFYLNHNDYTKTIGKFINHSKIHDNLKYKIYVRKDGQLDVLFFAKSKIVPNTELLWNYGKTYSGVEDCVDSCKKCKKCQPKT